MLCRMIGGGYGGIRSRRQGRRRSSGGSDGFGRDPRAFGGGLGLFRHGAGWLRIGLLACFLQGRVLDRYRFGCRLGKQADLAEVVRAAPPGEQRLVFLGQWFIQTLALDGRADAGGKWACSAVQHIQR
ncbi:MAG: hypothetical protein OHK0022_21450 [Roseiflexaceae bacterium]